MREGEAGGSCLIEEGYRTQSCCKASLIMQYSTYFASLTQLILPLFCKIAGCRLAWCQAVQNFLPSSSSHRVHFGELTHSNSSDS